MYNGLILYLEKQFLVLANNDFKEVLHDCRADYDHNYTDTKILPVIQMD